MLLGIILISHINKEGFVPSFQQNTDNNSISNDILETINEDVTLRKLTLSNGNVHEFLYCSIMIDSSIFEKSSSIGKSHYSDAGGVIFTTFSQLVCDNVTFLSNVASIGGAIASISTKLYLITTKFTENMGLKYGGALYYTGSESDLPSDVLIIQNSNFSKNVGLYLGGAVFLYKPSECSISKCQFSSNEASISGGCIFANYAKLYAILCRFESNIVHNMNLEVIKNANLGTNAMIPRGGGSISFGAANSKNTYELLTQECCFINNSVTNGILFANGNPGDNVILDGSVIYTSKGDSIDIKKINTANSRYSIISKPIVTLIDIENGNDKCNYSDEKNGIVVNYSQPSPSNSAKETINQIPSPTKYTYVATPITRLSFLIYSPVNPSKKLNIPNISIPEYHPKISPRESSSSNDSTCSSSCSISLTRIETDTYTHTNQCNGNTNFTIFTWIKTETVISTYINIVTSDGIAIDGGSLTKNNIPLIIGISACVLIILIAIGITVAIIYKKGEITSSSTETYDNVMKVEQVNYSNDFTGYITNLNPLFSTQITGDDDPFRQDFEEKNEDENVMILGDLTFGASDSVENKISI